MSKNALLTVHEIKCLYIPPEGKGKVAPVLLTDHDAMKAYWGVEV
jgi:hypothetical protein